MFKSNFLKNVLTLVSGTTLAQIITVAVSPILTRLYSPEEFGSLSLYISIVSFLFIFSTLRYELAIILPKKRIDALHLFFGVIGLNLFFSTIVFIIIGLCYSEIERFFGGELGYWLYLAPVSLASLGIYQAAYYWNLREANYKRLSSNKVIQATSVVSCNIAISGASFNGMILGYLFGQIVAVLALISKSNIKHKISRYTPLRIIVLAKKYKKVPMFSFPNSLLDSVRLLGINLCISKLFAASVLGYFTLAWKMLQLPSAVIGSALSQVFMKEVSQKEEKLLYVFTKRFLIKLFLIASPFFIFLFFYSELLFTFVFGQEWSIAGKMASILTPWLFFNFISTPIANVLIVTNMQHISLIAAIPYMLVPIALIIIYQSLDIILILQLVSTSMSIILILYMIISLFFLRRFSNVKS